MSTLSRHLALVLLAGMLSAGAAFADEGKNACGDAQTASADAKDHGGFAKDDDAMVGRNQSAGAEHKVYAASSPIAWQPGNPFRDDTAG